MEAQFLHFWNLQYVYSHSIHVQLLIGLPSLRALTTVQVALIHWTGFLNNSAKMRELVTHQRRSHMDTYFKVQIWNIFVRSIAFLQRKTFTLSRKYAVYSGPITEYLCWGENIYFALPFPIFDLVHVQNIRSFGIRMISCFHVQLLPGNLYLPIRETAHYPEHFVPVYNFSAHAPCLS